MTEPFKITDRRGVSRSASGLIVGGADREFNRMRRLGQAGLPNSPFQAKLEAKRMGSIAEQPGSLSDNTRAMAAQMRRSRMSNMRRTGSNMEMAMPKVRVPLSSLQDKQIPWNMANVKEQEDCRTWARLFYATHDLIPLLVDIYAKFPVTGLEFQSDDPKIEQFYTQMFLDELNYEEFLPDALGREYFISGEVTTLAHFNEQLGVWSSEEVLNPDMVRVSKSIFRDEERVQLLVKDMVEALRTGPGGLTDKDESHSERMERNWEYQQLTKNYPEIIKAAAQDDGLDISEALWSRIVNRAAPWDQRGTPFLLRSFRTLMMEESLNAAQDSVADRLYSPLILATLGIQDMGDGEPWIPDQSELDDLREDMQVAFAADFKLMCHHFGLQITPVFGRETVPRFDQDYDRIDLKLMQAWGIGQALIMGGAGAAGTYASSALNREVCENLMSGFQKKVIRHMNKRMEIIAEAQEHYETELKGGRPRPVYREVVEEDPETGEERIVRVPKLKIPEVKFRTLNLRDEATERQFITSLKEIGVPVSDKSLAVNLPIDWKQELQRQAEETVDKLVAEGEAMDKAQKVLDEKGMPYPAELAQYLTQTLVLRQQLAQTKLLETQSKQMEQQADQMSPAGQLGLLPGTQAQPGMPGGPPAVDEDGNPIGPPGGPEAAGPVAGGADGAQPDMGDGTSDVAEPPRNRARPPESDEMRAGSPRAAKMKRAAKRKDGGIQPLSKFEKGPSSYGHSFRTTEAQVEAAVTRRDLVARHPVPRVSDLVNDPEFFRLLNMGAYESQLKADWPEVQAGGAPESAKLLHEMVEHYQDVTGITPDWN